MSGRQRTASAFAAAAFNAALFDRPVALDACEDATALVEAQLDCSSVEAEAQRR